MRKQFVVTGALALLIVVGVWYAIIAKTPGSKPVTRADMQSVSVRMKWFYAGTMAGWFAGKEQDIFKEAGLIVAITPGGRSIVSRRSQ